jgi:glucose-1-phosphate cytidylyltransferase
MQVVILCGGQGTRIRDVAEDLPKPLVPIGGKPILWHIMKGFAEQGFDDFILCLGYKSWLIKRYFLDYQAAQADFSLRLAVPEQVQILAPEATENWQVTLAETGLEAMTGCRVKRIEKYITGDHFFLTYGDGVADVDLPKLLEFHHDHGKIATVTSVQPSGRFGELEFDGDRVLQFTEKPVQARGWINGGFFVLQRRIFSYLPDDPGLTLEGPPMQELTREGELMAYRHDGFWHPMDNSRDFKYLNALWDERRAPWNIWDKPDRLKGLNRERTTHGTQEPVLAGPSRLRDRSHRVGRRVDR